MNTNNNITPFQPMVDFRSCVENKCGRLSKKTREELIHLAIELAVESYTTGYLESTPDARITITPTS